MKKYNQTQRMEGWSRWAVGAVALSMAIMGVVWIVMAIADDENTGWGLFATILSVIIFVFPVACWIHVMNIKVTVDSKWLRVGLWPIPSTKVQLDSIKSVDIVEVSGMNEYWGWGVKGTKKDLFYGLDDGQAVQVIYEHPKKGKCSLKILVDNPEDLMRILNAA